MKRGIRKTVGQNVGLDWMGSRRKKRMGSLAAESRSHARTRWFVAGAVSIAALVVVGWFARTTMRRDVNDGAASRPSLSPASSSQPRPESATLYTDADVNNAANRLFAAVNPGLPENAYFPPFAKAKISWVIEQRKTGRLSFILLKNVADAGLSFEAMMASARPEGKPVILISRPRFIEFLSDGGLGGASFTRQQRNDFTLSLVHEVVHLENPGISSETTLQSHLIEEQRAWREVDINVVREFQRLKQPMNVRFTDADNAIRACRDTLPCEPLKTILLPTENSRF